MAKGSYKDPGGESSLTGSKGLKHNEPVSKQWARHMADHVETHVRKHSDEDGWQNEPQTHGEHQEVDVLTGKRD